MPDRQVFIAVQCCECSTMQVKQQKKSSNKWICAICNTRQSVRKVFARSYLAKDVRGFVQSSNLARSEMASPVPALICNRTVSEFEHPLRCSSDDTRIDWSRYLDSDAEDEGPEADLNVVTEMPTQKKSKRGAVTKFPPKRGLRSPVRRGNEKRLRLAVEESSKWSEYWQEDGTHERVEAAGVSPDRHVGFDGELQSQSSGAVFDEEVHPDFL